MAQTGEGARNNSSLKIRLRGYQQEMLAKSLERNVIVAMPTGSENTLVENFVGSIVLTDFHRRQDSHRYRPDPS